MPLGYGVFLLRVIIVRGCSAHPLTPRHGGRPIGLIAAGSHSLKGSRMYAHAHTRTKRARARTRTHACYLLTCCRSSSRDSVKVEKQ